MVVSHETKRGIGELNCCRRNLICCQAVCPEEPPRTCPGSDTIYRAPCMPLLNRGSL